MQGALLTDLYQLTMLQAYFDRGMNESASFEFFVRKLPAQRNFLMAAGLEEVLAYLQGLQLWDDELRWLAASGRFSTPFVRSLENLRFTGDVWAMPEGTVFFADEPILRVTAPLREAQLVESRIINLLHYETLVASKAARCVLAAPGKVLVDFGMRRAHAGEAALLSARASYLAGFSGTATVQAGMAHHIPLYGTMAHSYVQACDDEALAFEAFARSQAGGAVLLIDTYDTEAAARKVVALAARLPADRIHIKGVRIDSGDLVEHARRVRAILDAGGLQEVGIFASGSLDEHKVQALMQAGAPIEGFGIGTRMNTSADAPYLDCAYKLVEYAGRARRKRSEDKATWPGRKQVLRHFGADGGMAADTLGLHDERGAGKPLLELVMVGGRREIPAPGLDVSREHARWQLAAMPARLRTLEPADAYPVEVSLALNTLARRVDPGTGHALPSSSNPSAQANCG